MKKISIKYIILLFFLIFCLYGCIQKENISQTFASKYLKGMDNTIYYLTEDDVIPEYKGREKKNVVNYLYLENNILYILDSKNEKKPVFKEAESENSLRLLNGKEYSFIFNKKLIFENIELIFFEDIFEMKALHKVHGEFQYTISRYNKELRLPEYSKEKIVSKLEERDFDFFKKNLKEYNDGFLGSLSILMYEGKDYDKILSSIEKVPEVTLSEHNIKWNVNFD
ncbi:MAG: hypothetical protein ACQESP_07685 [Candidatus Muiribacteriota bacterium]